MARKGQILKDNTDGTVVEFLETSADTSGQRFRVKITSSKKGVFVPDHMHELQDEEFEVLSGTLTYKIGKEVFKLKAGEKVLLPKGTGHNHYNDDDNEVVYIQTNTPAYDVEYFFENLVGLSNDGKLKNGQAGFLQTMVIVKYLKGKSYLADMPLPIQKVLANIFGPIGRMLGYRASYPKYCGVEI